MNKARVAHTLYRLGYVFFLLNDIEAAERAYLQSKALFEEINSAGDLTYVLSELGSFHVSLGNFGLADQYSRDSLRLADLKERKPSIIGTPLQFGNATAWRNLGAVSLWSWRRPLCNCCLRKVTYDVAGNGLEETIPTSRTSLPALQA